MRRSSRALGYCQTHQKLLYVDKKQARVVAKLHKGAHKNVYECSVIPDMFHVGEIPEEVIRGEITRTEFFGGAR